MIALAMLLGSDYTEGVKGVGIVNAMEILKGFDINSDLRDGLTRFRKWMDDYDPEGPLSSRPEARDGLPPNQLIFQRQHRAARIKWQAPSNFPSDGVIKAYLDPVVDRSEERFTWGGR